MQARVGRLKSNGLVQPFGVGESPLSVRRRKVGKPLEEAIFAKPNCAKAFQRALPVSRVSIQMGPVLDGVAVHMADYAEDEAFQPAQREPVDAAQAPREGRQRAECPENRAPSASSAGRVKTGKAGVQQAVE